MKFAFLLVACAAAYGFQSAANFTAGDAPREPYQHATQLVAALELKPGDWTADVGAGGGYYSMRLSRLVGDKGKVIAEDISEAAIRNLKARQDAFDLHNVEILKGEPDDPKLPDSRLAAVLVVDAYHHFDHLQAMLRAILRSLRPAGRLVIADYSRPEDRTLDRETQVKRHEIDPAIVRSEIEMAGFQVLDCNKDFAPQVPDAKYARAAEAPMWVIPATRAGK